MKRAVIILGAGAAKAWDAMLTPELTDLVKKDTEFKTKSDVPLGQFVCDRLSEFYKGSDGINFETIINTLESIQNYFLNKTVIGASPNHVSSYSVWFAKAAIVTEMMNFEFASNGEQDEFCVLFNKANKESYTCHKTRKEATYFSEAIKHFLKLIRNSIARYSYSLQSEKFNEANLNVRNFMLHLINYGFLPRVYTTNYDRLIPEIFKNDKTIEFFDGFDICGGKSNYGKQYLQNIPRILNDFGCQTYYNLHGSIYWDYKSIEPDLGYQYFCTPNESHPVTYYNLGEHTNPGDNTIIYNIVTGYNKLQRVSLEPLNSFHAAFAMDCINADLIITIGYSFSDFHINRPIKNAFRNKNPQHLHITWGIAQYRTSKEFIYLENQLLRMKSEYTKDVFQDEKWIISKSGRQVIYSSGFKDFLENEAWKSISF